MKVIGLDGERQNLPPLFRALAFEEFPTACGH